MDAFEFLSKFDSCLEEISMVIKPELNSLLIELKEIDPHDLIHPDNWFLSDHEVRGFVWNLFIKRVNKI